LILIFLNESQQPIKRVRGARSLDYEETPPEVENRKPDPRRQPAPPPPPAPVPKKNPVESLREELLGLAPSLYYGVRLESLIRKDDPTAIDSTASVEAVEFSVKAKKWDKVAILNSTFGYLKTEFPNLTQTVRLIFDDGRPDLDLRFE
jgi:hypothetical protein